MAALMKSVVVSAAHGPWELQDRDVPEVGPNDVLVRVRACGICGTDLWISDGVLAFRDFPLVPGHEAAGEVVAVGEGVTKRKVGDRVGAFMAQKFCGVCAFCHEEHPNSFVSAANCANPTLTGVTVDGGHAEYVAVDAGGTVLIPTHCPTRRPPRSSAPATRSGRGCAGPRPRRVRASRCRVSVVWGTSRSSTRRPAAST